MQHLKKRIAKLISLTLLMTSIPIKTFATPLVQEVQKTNEATFQTTTEDAINVTTPEEIQIEPNIIDEKKDSDEDGLVDVLEKYFGTNPKKLDTDEDGLSDYIEIILAIDPLKKDTDGNSIEDGLEDTDKDGLTNLEEIKLDTNLFEKDTDSDGVLEGDEIKVYQTNPTLEDTDGDTLTDGDEILLGLNPVKQYSDELTLDSNRKIHQNLSDEKVAVSLKESTNLVVPSLSGAISKVMDKELFLDKYDNDALQGNHAVIGAPIQVKTLLKTENELQLSFDYSNFLNYYNEAEVDMLTICQFKEDDFVPLETKKDDANNSLYTNISGEGSYFVLHVEKFLDSLGINMPVHYSGAKIMKLQDKIGKEVNDGREVLLSNYQYIKLEDKVFQANVLNIGDDSLSSYQCIKLKDEASQTNESDSDNDGLSDYKELGTRLEKDLTPFVKQLLKVHEIPEALYTGKTSVTVYKHISNPILADTDYDGKNDNIDTNPKENFFTGRLHTDYADSTVSYTMDYRDFFRSNTTYSSSIGTISSLYSAVIYDNNTYSGMDITHFMEEHGIYDVRGYDFTSDYSDSDVSEVYIGHRKVSYEGKSKEIIAMVVRGTNGTIKEWTSNFDIGSTADKYKYSDWVVEENHKGFDVAATRILRCLKEYEDREYIDKSMPTVYWVMGHSRGAGIANIIGARLLDQSEYVYAYTFAAPNTTTADNATRYEGIYNILNKDDFVPYLPMSDWKFKHYGQSVTISIADNFEKEWEDLTRCKNHFGIVDYNMDAIGMSKTIEKIGAIVQDRNECYRFTCNCHGEGNLDNITIRNRGTSRSSREEAIAKIPNNALPYCAITRYDGKFFAGWDFEVCQQPEYFMQILAAYMGGDIGNTRFAVELNIADRYESAKTAIIRSGLGGLEHPHYTESYYLLSTHINASSF